MAAIDIYQNIIMTRNLTCCPPKNVFLRDLVEKLDLEKLDLNKDLDLGIGKKL